MSDTDQCARCGGDCPMTKCPVCGGCEDVDCKNCASPVDAVWAGDYDYDGSVCEHDCFEDGCDENVAEGGYYCLHEHCPNCGECGCPGYCDDYQTYNLRPAETGGQP